MARRQKKQPGLMLYFEDYASLRSSLDAEELVSVLDVMTSYAETGSLPDEESLSPAAKICWRFMRPKIDRDAQNYLDICAKRTDAANKRWSAEASENSGDANACKCIESMQKEQKQKFMPTTTTTTTTTATSTATAAEVYAPAAGDDLSSQIAAHQRADDLIRRYNLPDGDTTREALLEDAERAGFDRLEEALKQAALSNNRRGLSVNFYRSILFGNEQQRRSAKNEIVSRNYEETACPWRLEVL